MDQQEMPSMTPGMLRSTKAALRRQEVLRRRRDGETRGSIARDLGIHPSGVTRMVRQAEREEKE